MKLNTNALRAATLIGLSVMIGACAPSRAPTTDLRIDLADGRLDSCDVELIRSTTVLGDNGKPLDPQTFDMEGIASALDGSVYISSEGAARALILISDNNFNRTTQITQILAVAVPAELTPPY